MEIISEERLKRSKNLRKFFGKNNPRRKRGKEKCAVEKCARLALEGFTCCAAHEACGC